ncbi:dienelactone hydrolase family protein [Nocardia higoensis]|uniref:Dienelactone hydrolase family protein n=1 Tax=Nocardia higoensis TaxID=228599 RepID=A0ABS0D5N1_9NOCA|nr:dienelactone hydrolase family protein [Nocardia higoensis]
MFDQDVRIPVAEGWVEGHLTVPDDAIAAVVFAHGSGSSRHSPRNRFVAEVLQRADLATLLLDLLTPGEEAVRANVFDIDLLARRLVEATRWLTTRPETAALRIAYFGASTGAGAALRAATSSEVSIAAVVSRGGRPDLAGPALTAVRSPTLLIVGGDDHVVLELNREAARAMRCEVTVTVVPGATHLFSEPGALEQVAELARDWLIAQLTPR